MKSVTDTGRLISSMGVDVLPLWRGVVAVAAHVCLGHRLRRLAVQQPGQLLLVVLVARVLLRRGGAECESRARDSVGTCAGLRSTETAGRSGRRGIEWVDRAVV